MRWPRRNIVIGASAAAAAIGLAVALAIVLPGSTSTPAAPAPTGSPALSSPFTGEPISAPGPVLAVKIDNLRRPGRRPGSPTPISSTSSRSRAA